MAITELPAEMDYLDLPLRERRRRFEEREQTAGADIGTLEVADEGARKARSGTPADAAPLACSVCSAPIDADRIAKGAKTCAAEACIVEARRRREAARRVRRAEARSARLPATNGSAMDAGPDGRLEPADGPPEAANGKTPTDLGPIYRALMLAGATVTRLELEVAGECWTVTRTTTNGGTPP